MAYQDNKNTNVNTSLPSSGKGGSTIGKINIKSIAKKFEKKVSKFIDKIPNNSNKTVNLYNTFGKVEDNIEFNVYDINDNLISHTRNFKDYIFTEEGIGSGANYVIGKRLRDLYNKITVSNVIFDSPVGPEVLTSSPEGKFQTQIRVTFEIYEEL